ncbi:SdpI family protein [Flavobacterium sp. PLA-1-15]|uniref:SdpI family protein n=1 Tax=Flavobacterium sp. PLA-1-15 TaxID=3380533 RepID=UPI003B77EE47
MEWTENVLQISLLTSGIFALAGIVQYVFRPKEINSLYGYRTKSSMASEERWHFAQRYSALKMITVGVFFILISMITLLIELNEVVQLIVQIVLLTVGIAYLFYATEKALKTRFPKN